MTAKARVVRMTKQWLNEEGRRSPEGRRTDGARFHPLPAPTNPEIPVNPAAAPLSSQPPASTFKSHHGLIIIIGSAHKHNRKSHKQIHLHPDVLPRV